MKVYNWIFNALSGMRKPRCFLCETTDPYLKSGLCPACLNDFPLNRSACLRCGSLLPADNLCSNGPDPVAVPAFDTNSLQQQRLCGACLANPPAWHTLRALCQYQYPAPHLIQGLKYRAQFANAKQLSRLFITELTQNKPQPLPQCLLPVPLHPSRQQQRGFNQAIELARPVARHFNIPLDTRSVRRTLNTPAQANLDKNQRLYNLNNAFSLQRQPACSHVALFDDVVTTGSTVSSLCKLLTQAGVQRVDVWCIARASKID